MSILGMFKNGADSINQSVADGLINQLAEKLIANGVKSVFITTKNNKIDIQYHKEDYACIPRTELNEMINELLKSE